MHPAPVLATAPRGWAPGENPRGMFGSVKSGSNRRKCRSAKAGDDQLARRRFNFLFALPDAAEKSIFLFDIID
jgi:hypothetical protein